MTYGIKVTSKPVDPTLIVVDLDTACEWCAPVREEVLRIARRGGEPVFTLDRTPSRRDRFLGDESTPFMVVAVQLMLVIAAIGSFVTGEPLLMSLLTGVLSVALLPTWPAMAKARQALRIKELAHLREHNATSYTGYWGTENSEPWQRAIKVIRLVEEKVSADAAERLADNLPALYDLVRSVRETTEANQDINLPSLAAKRKQDLTAAQKIVDRIVADADKMMTGAKQLPAIASWQPADPTMRLPENELANAEELR